MVVLEQFGGHAPGGSHYIYLSLPVFTTIFPLQILRSVSNQGPVYSQSSGFIIFCNISFYVLWAYISDSWGNVWGILCGLTPNRREHGYHMLSLASHLPMSDSWLFKNP
jgi:hypothetical protein